VKGALFVTSPLLTAALIIARLIAYLGHEPSTEAVMKRTVGMFKILLTCVWLHHGVLGCVCRPVCT
jgi:hypothetical protein